MRWIFRSCGASPRRARVTRRDCTPSIARSERYVPFYLYGKSIRNGFRITRPGRITDICSTIAYLLGVRYPDAARGQVFTEALEECPPRDTREALSLRFNRVKYDSEAGHYDADHPEI